MAIVCRVRPDAEQELERAPVLRVHNLVILHGFDREIDYQPLVKVRTIVVHDIAFLAIRVRMVENHRGAVILFVVDALGDIGGIIVTGGPLRRGTWPFGVVRGVEDCKATIVFRSATDKAHIRADFDIRNLVGGTFPSAEKEQRLNVGRSRPANCIGLVEIRRNWQ